MIWRSAVVASRLCIGFRCSIHTSSRLFAEALRDEAIRARYVRFIDFETGMISDRSQRTSHLLRSIDRTRFWLVQVKESKFDAGADASGAEQQGGAGGVKKGSPSNRPPKRLNRDEERYRDEVESYMPLEDLAIVKLVDKKEDYNKQKQIKLEKKQGKLSSSTSTSDSATQKEVEMSWSSTSNDVQHKLKHVLNHLKKRGPGARVTVRIKSKKGKGRSGGMEEEEKMELLQRIENYLCDWDNTGEESATEMLFHGRKVGEVEWQGGKSMAMMRVDVAKGRKKVATPTSQADSADNSVGT